MPRGLCCALFFLFGVKAAASPDTLRISTYNLLFYGVGTANRVALKNPNLQPILSYIRPHIACFNEIGNSVPGLLDTLLGVAPYPMQHGGYHNTTGTNILDGLFWRSGLFVKERDSIICSEVRDIVAYDLYYNDSMLGRGADTVRLKVITAHLKSSNATTDRSARASETARVSAYLASLHGSANYIMLGDFNLYKSSEVAYQNLVAPADTLARLNDPLNLPGSWDENPAFAICHTQSPRSTALGDGGATGGMDSRFDFILVSDAVMRGSKGLKFIPGSYTVVGNDGAHYDKAVTDTPNTSVPYYLLQPLLQCSDHLPVYADFIINGMPAPPQPTSAVAQGRPLEERIRFVNPVQGSIRYVVSGLRADCRYSLRSIDGRLLQEGILSPEEHQIQLQGEPATGWYLLTVYDAQTGRATWKLRKD